MKEDILQVLYDLGFRPELVEGMGYEFYYEGNQYLYTPKDDNETFLCICAPVDCVLDITDKDELVELLYDINATAKYVKTYMIDGYICLFYERELMGNEDLPELIQRMIVTLARAYLYTQKVCKRRGKVTKDYLETEKYRLN